MRSKGRESDAAVTKVKVTPDVVVSYINEPIDYRAVTIYRLIPDRIIWRCGLAARSARMYDLADSSEDSHCVN